MSIFLKIIMWLLIIAVLIILGYYILNKAKVIGTFKPFDSVLKSAGIVSANGTNKFKLS